MVEAMPERGGVQKAVIASGLVVAGLAVGWVGVAIVLGIGIGRVIRRAEHEEIGEPEADQPEPPVDMPLLGVVRPREAQPAS